MVGRNATPSTAAVAAAAAVVRERQDSYENEKLPGNEESEDDVEPGILQAMIEMKDFRLFLIGGLGLLTLNGFVAIYFTLTSRTSIDQ